MTPYRNVIPVGCLSLVLGCAPPLPKPAPEINRAKAAATPSSEYKSAPLATMNSAKSVPKPLVANPTKTPSEPIAPVQSPTTSAELYLTELGEVQAMSGEQSRRELVEFNSGKRLDKMKRFRLAALLARDEHGDWERALKALDGLVEDADPRTNALIDVLRKSLRARLDLRQQTARVTELQQRIQQIKTLEKDLQLRSEPAKTP